jgi:hypothetical protein
MLRVNREDFLRQIGSVLPGLSTREIIEQSSCFVFQDGNVMTYNDEIACTQACDLKVTGAVQAMPLINILRKLVEEEIDIEVTKKSFVIKGKRKRATISMESKILLPVDDVEKPRKWKDLPDDFADAIHIVQQCAGKDESRFDFTCIHLHPDRIEACDGSQAALYEIDMPLSKPTLVRKESLKYIVSLDMTKFSRSKNWIHFKNSSGLVLSCRRWIYSASNFPNVRELLKVKGSKTVLPKGLAEAISKAKVFSTESTEEDQVIIELTKNKLKITGQGVSGRYVEYKKIKYTGKDLKFAIAPDLLADLVNRHNECRISSDKLKVVTGKYSYVTALVKVK